MLLPSGCFRAKSIFCLRLEFFGFFSEAESGFVGGWDVLGSRRSSQNPLKQRHLCSPCPGPLMGHRFSTWNSFPAGISHTWKVSFFRRKGSFGDAERGWAVPQVSPVLFWSHQNPPRSLLSSELLNTTPAPQSLLALGPELCFPNDKNLFFPAPVKTEISQSCKASQVCCSRLWHLLTLLEPGVLK